MYPSGQKLPRLEEATYDARLLPPRQFQCRSWVTVTLDSKELNAQIIQSAEVAILTINSEGVVTSWNAAAQRLYGHTAKAVIGKNFTMLMSPDVQLEHAERLRRVRSGQRVEAFTTRHAHQFGHWLNVRVQISALTSAAGTVTGATLFVVPRSAHNELRASVGGTRADINSATDFALEALGNANLDLLEARAQMELLLQAHADSATLTVGLDGRVKTWSSAARRVLGYTSEQILGQPMELLYPPEERISGRADQALRMAAQHGRYEEESARLREDGSRFWARRVISALRDETGQLVGYAKIIQDLTDSQQFQAKLQRLELGLSEAPDAVLLTDADLIAGAGTRIVYANHGFEILSGYPLEELVGRTPRMLQGADTDRAMLERLRTTLEQGGVFVAETTNYRRDRSAYRVRWQILPLRDVNARVTHFLSIQQNATSRNENFITSLSEIVRVTDFLGQRSAGGLRGSLELLGGAGMLMQLLAMSAQSGSLTLGASLHVQLDCGRIVGVEHPHMVGLEAVLDALRFQSGDYEFVAGDAARPAVPLELELPALLLEASRRGASTPMLAEPVFASRPALEGLVVLPHVAAAVAFAQSMGSQHFEATLEEVAQQALPCVVLRGRGFKVMALNGQLADVPSGIARA